MVDLIFTYAVKTVLIIICCVLYVFFVSKILPALFLSPKNKNISATDRGIKKYVFHGGRAIVYTPDVKTKKYINQYILSDNNGERFLKCKFDNRIVTALYEVIVFDSSDKVIDTIRVYDTPDCREIARAVPLPITAAYVKLSVVEVNHKNVSVQTGSSISLMSYLSYIVLTIAATIAISLLFNAATAHVADLTIGYTEKFGGLGIAFPIVSALIVSAIYIIRTIKKSRTPH